MISDIGDGMGMQGRDAGRREEESAQNLFNCRTPSQTLPVSFAFSFRTR